MSIPTQWRRIECSTRCFRLNASHKNKIIIIIKLLIFTNAPYLKNSSQKSVIFLSWSLLRSSSLQPRNHDYHGDYNFNCDHNDDDRHYITDHDHLIIMIIMAAIINNNNNLFSSTEWKRQWTDL